MGDGLLVGAKWWIHQHCFDSFIFLYCVTFELRQAIILHALSSTCNTWGTHLAQTLTVLYTHPRWYAAHWQRVSQGQSPSYTLVPLNEFLDMHSVDLRHLEALLCSSIVVTSVPDANARHPLATCCLDITLLYTSLRCHWMWIANNFHADKLSKFSTLSRESIFPSGSPSCSCCGCASALHMPGIT